MFSNFSSFLPQDRGKSTGGKIANQRPLRYLQPKFLSSLGQNNHEPMKSKIETSKLVVKKQNIAPEQLKFTSAISSAGYKDNRIPLNKTGISIFQKTSKEQSVKVQYCNVRGLHNIGNTCYMNSTLQCLFHLPIFNTQIKKEFKQMKKGSVTKQYCQLLEQLMFQSGSNAQTPSDFKRSLGKKKPRFIGSSQQDAQQFLTSFLEIINEELTHVENKPDYKELQNDPKKKSISKLSDEWWDYYLARDNSIISDLFQGQVISSVKCKKCSQESVTFDNLWGIPVSISKGKSVVQLLSQNWQAQSLIDDYNCSQCKKTRICSKSLEFFRLPQILVIQLKRFQYGKYTKRKKTDDVKIDSKLDLSPLISSQSPARENNNIYQLRGVIHHFGDTDFGHYIATIFCQKTNKWYEMNDSKYSQTSPQLSSKSAYLLFYEKSN